MKRKPVLRRCIVTKEQLEKKQLIRVVKNKNNEVFVDLTGRANGRGAYLTKSLKVIEVAKKRKSLERALDTTIDSKIYEQLEEIVK